MSNYRKTMTEALQEVYSLDESVIDKVKEIASKKSAKKIDGVMVDSFTASAISQIYDKVNDANKKKMEKLPITNLANLAFKMMQKNGYVPEEVLASTLTIEENKIDKDGKIHMSKKDYAKKPKDYKGKRNGKPTLMALDPKSGATTSFEVVFEEVELDEGTKQVLAHGGKGKYKVTKDGDKIEIKFGGKVVGTADFDRGADSFFVSIKGEKGQKSFDDAQAIADYFAKNKITEEVELDEDASNFKSAVARIKKAKSAKDLKKLEKSFERVYKQTGALTDKEFGQLDDMISDKLVKLGEEVDLDEGKMSQLHQYIKDKKSAEEIAKLMKLDVKTIKALMSEEVDLDEGKMSQLHQYIKDKKSAEQIAKLMKLDVKTIKALMSEVEPDDEEEEIKEGAASDARRAMMRDKDLRRGKDSADRDNSATDDDVKAASKNIMMQLRKSISLKGKFDVEFGDKKKVKIPAKMAHAVTQKYNSLKKPADKEKFQAKVAKSYKHMLRTMKEGFEPSETILERMNRKLRENKNG